MDNLYSDGIYDAEPNSLESEEMFSQMKQLNKRIRRLSKKRREAKRARSNLNGG